MHVAVQHSAARSILVQLLFDVKQGPPGSKYVVIARKQSGSSLGPLGFKTLDHGTCIDVLEVGLESVVLDAWSQSLDLSGRWSKNPAC